MPGERFIGPDETGNRPMTDLAQRWRARAERSPAPPAAFAPEPSSAEPASALEPLRRAPVVVQGDSRARRGLASPASLTGCPKPTARTARKSTGSDAHRTVWAPPGCAVLITKLGELCLVQREAFVAYLRSLASEPASRRTGFGLEVLNARELPGGLPRNDQDRRGAPNRLVLRSPT